ncbi:BTB/POZ domain-containing protein 9 [Halotydeus destructor]|nr:BTB/POZ domain-containing protein 9 [Halotydeus destructor]
MAFRSGQAYYRDGTHLVELTNYLFFKEFEDRDFTFIVNGDRIKVHKVIVKNNSERFLEHFKEWEKDGKDAVEINVKPFSGDTLSSRVFKLFIQFCYTGSLSWKEVNDTVQLDLLALCHEFGMFTLSEALCNENKLTKWNIWNFYRAANVYELQSLSDSCIRFIDLRASDCLTQPDCPSVEPELFMQIMDRDTLFAKEMAILKALLVYLKKTKHEMSKQVQQDLLKTVRWTLITAAEFESTVLPTGFLTTDEFETMKKDKKESERVHPDKFNNN